MPANLSDAAAPVIAQPPPPADLPARANRMSFVLWFDFLLLILFLIALAPRLTGLAIHEIVGIAFTIFFLLHILISWQWIKAGARKLLVTGANRMRANYLLNAALFVFTCVAIAAGLVISQVALPALGIPSVNDNVWHFLHNRMASWIRIGVGLHIAMNWQWIVAAVRRQAASWRGRRADAQAAIMADPLRPFEDDSQ